MSDAETNDNPYESLLEPLSILSDKASPYNVTNSEEEHDDVMEYDTEFTPDDCC